MTRPIVNSLSADQRRHLLVQLLREKAAASSEGPLSHGQRALWLLHQLAPTSPAYNVVQRVRIHSLVDVSALRRSFESLADRHGILRTVYPAKQGSPVRNVLPHIEVPFETVDATSWSDQQLNERLDADADRPFDLQTGPVMRVSLFTRSPTDHVLLLTLHHIATDFWSLDVIVEDLVKLYAAARSGANNPPRPSVPSYAEYVRWEAEMLAGPEGDRLWGYWRDRLAGELPTLELPTDRPRPPVLSYRGGMHEFRLGRELTAQLRALARAEKTTLFVTLLTAFQALLSRYSDQEDFVIGSPVAGRSRAEFEAIAGYFVNLVALRSDLAGNPSFRELLGRTKGMVADALAHQDYPFSLLVERLQPARDPGRSPVLQVLFTWDRPRRQEVQGLYEPGDSDRRVDFGGLKVGAFTSAQRGAPFDLTLTIAEGPETLLASMEYSTDLFDAATIVRIASHFQIILAGVVDNPGLSLAELPLLSEQEREQVVVEFNRTAPSFTESPSIQERFTAHAHLTPDAVAIVSGEIRLKYRDVNVKANRLAHRLRRLGVGRDTLVAICLDRGPDAVVAVLAVLKAGGAYIPLDCASPKDRLTQLISEAGPTLLIADSSVAIAVADFLPNLAWIDPQDSHLAEKSEEDPPCVAGGDNLAYVIYTSGSTGLPRGAMVTHAALANTCDAWEQAYRLGSARRCHLQMANFAFDVFTGDLVRALCWGGTLVFCPRELLLDPEQLFDLMWREQVTSADFVPAVLMTLVSHLEQTGHRLDFLRLLIVGSDAWRVAEYERAVRLCGPKTRLLSCYGLTEAAIDSTYFESNSFEEITTELSPSAFVPIGKPFANVRVYVLDGQFRPVPVGVPGEICVGGAGVARGYLGNPELTAQKFIPNPFASEPGARVYRTGDRGRWLPGGTLEFRGRTDEQIKLRGHRVELGEVEAALMRHPSVQKAVVVASEAGPAGRRLLAWVVAAPDQSPSTVELRDFLRSQVPEYMVPSAITLRPSLPLTPNGKIDRRALIPAAPHANSTEFVPPRTSLEQKLAGIWAQLLGVERVSAHANFFDLGGHSLLAVQLRTRMQDELKAVVPLALLFESPTIAGLAAALERAAPQPAKAGPVPPPIRPVARERYRLAPAAGEDQR